jgi:hypothetical protein
MSAPNIKSVEELYAASESPLANKLNTLITRAVENSFKLRQCRRTAAEEKRRVELCFGVITQCRDAEQPIHRVMDVLDNLLIMAIDGEEVHIQDGGIWCVSGSGIQVPVSSRVFEAQDINREQEDSINNPSMDQLLKAAEANERTQ